MLLPSADIGGAEAMTTVLARALARAGVAVEIAVAPELAGRLAGLLGPDLAPAISPTPLAWDATQPVAQTLRRQRLVAATRLIGDRPDAAIIPLPWPSHGLGFLGPLRDAGVPTLALVHLAPRDPDPAIAEAVALAPPPDWPGLAWAAVAAPTARRTEAALGLTPGRVAVVPNGVPIPREDPGARAALRIAKRQSLALPADAPLIVTVGRLEPKKATDLLPGLAQALHRRCGATLAVLGDGPGRDLLEPYAAEIAGAAPPLRLLGRVHDVADWLLAADALLLPSRLEGCPLVFLEAAARRCPVIATEAALEAFGAAAWDIAALAPDDMVSALVDQAESLLAAPARRALIAEAAHRQAASWDEAAMLGALIGLLRGAVAATRVPDASARAMTDAASV